ncbi:MAG TPA: [FeFe] hydrogenase H-cluster radical SAM maturase HydG [Deltaproteobacteria bacterium]|nr:[FeFe] hydrogenase H-cluster radical SAM maturase HydG [Deltaproteobacteria bacterium]
MDINPQKIEDLLSSANPESSLIKDVLAKASLAKGLTLKESAVLLSVKSSDVLQDIYLTAGTVKEKVFGKRIVLFAPLYLSNYCTNNCLYCGFRKDNENAVRKALTIDEVISEAKALEEMGFKRILLVCGEDPKVSGLDYIINAVETIYKNMDIRIIHVNAPPMGVDDLKKLKQTGIGVYQAFQETYHIPTYRKMHPSGRKMDYNYRLQIMDRAIEAGFEDVGIGCLLGLYDYRFDCLAVIAHSQHLFEKFGTHAHTISVPRLRPASGSPIKDMPYPVADEDFKKIVAIYRLSVPSAGVVVSTRESAELREEVLQIGASQISAGSKTEPGGYSDRVRGQGSGVRAEEQFSTNDHRTMEEMILAIAKNGLLPSLCTTCYRIGRTGRVFTNKTLAGDMGKICQVNAILTLQEYILDHAKNGVGEIGKAVIEKGIEEIKEKKLKADVLKKLGEIKAGKRDVYV